MSTRTPRRSLGTAAFALVLVWTTSGLPQDLEPITLPPPQRTGGGPLMEALNARRTTRSIGEAPLAPQVLSNLLWAAYGVNRDQGPRGRVGRTAPSGMNLQPIDLYVATPAGVYLYEPVPHRLAPVVAKDVRAIANRSPVAEKVPVVLIYVVDGDRKPEPPPPGTPAPAGPPGPAPPWELPSFGEVETGFIGQNVYLFCASQGLAAWFHSTDKEALAEAMRLRPAQRVLYAQTVGHPSEKE
jgi:nitroreductase